MDESRIGKLDQAVRPVVILAFTAAIIYGFALKLISADAFLTIAGAVVMWLFTRRQPGNGNGTNAVPPTPTKETP